jgi:hypothetical protein
MTNPIQLRIVGVGTGTELELTPVFEVECGGIVVTFGRDKLIHAGEIASMFEAADVNPELGAPFVRADHA